MGDRHFRPPKAGHRSAAYKRFLQGNLGEAGLGPADQNQIRGPRWTSVQWGNGGDAQRIVKGKPVHTRDLLRGNEECPAGQINSKE